MRQVLVILTLALLSGCTTIHKLSPALPPKADSSEIERTDARRAVQFFESRGRGAIHVLPEVKIPLANLIGELAGDPVVMANDMKPMDIVADLVAVRFKKAKVTLIDFRCEWREGLWMNNIEAFIEAEINTAEGKTTVKGRGDNAWNVASKRNFEIAYEKALKDFAENLRLLPDDLSRLR